MVLTLSENSAAERSPSPSASSLTYAPPHSSPFWSLVSY